MTLHFLLTARVYFSLVSLMYTFKTGDLKVPVLLSKWCSLFCVALIPLIFSHMLTVQWFYFQSNILQLRKTIKLLMKSSISISKYKIKMIIWNYDLPEMNMQWRFFPDWCWFTEIRASLYIFLYLSNVMHHWTLRWSVGPCCFKWTTLRLFVCSVCVLSVFFYTAGDQGKDQSRHSSVFRQKERRPGALCTVVTLILLSPFINTMQY